MCFAIDRRQPAATRGSVGSCHCRRVPQPGSRADPQRLRLVPGTCRMCPDGGPTIHARKGPTSSGVSKRIGDRISRVLCYRTYASVVWCWVRGCTHAYGRQPRHQQQLGRSTGRPRELFRHLTPGTKRGVAAIVLGTRIRNLCVVCVEDGGAAYCRGFAVP